MFALCLIIVAFSTEPTSVAPPITAAVISPDGKHVVLGSQKGIEVRSWPDLQVTASIETELAHVHDLAFSRDGQYLLAAGGSPAEEGAVEVLSWPAGKRLRRIAGHQDVVYRVACSPDGQQWATAGADGICQVFAVDTGERVIRYEGHSRPVLALGYLPDGKTIVSAGIDQTLRLWDSGTGKHLRTLDNHVGAVNDVAVRPDSATDALPVVASISEDRTVRLWQPTIGRLMRFVKLPSTPRAVAWTPDGQQLLVGCNDGQLRVLDAETVEIVRETPAIAGRIHVLVLGPKSDRALIAGEAGAVVISW